MENIKRRSLDISKNRSKQLTKAMVSQAGLVIVFEDSQKQKILSLCYSAKGKVVILQELVGYTGYHANIVHSIPGCVPNPEARSWIFLDSYLGASITEIEHMLC
ncbi:MAG: hypothetical protein OEZ00_07980 [Dehalococcoidia bacterium]|nr:hypothetical protein [Dehalococcoidia bacterium]